MKLRAVIAVVAGLVVWAVTFPVLAFLEAQFWPALADAARTYFANESYAVFDTAMLASFQVMWLLTNAAAGFVTRLIGRRQIEVWVVGVLLVGYFAYNHLGALWDELPTWYNLLVVALVVPMVLAGGVAARRSGARREAGRTATAS